MGKCTICLEETSNKVNDNIGGKSYLCNKCESLFSQYKICNEYYFTDDMEDGFCNNCNEGN